MSTIKLNWKAAVEICIAALEDGTPEGKEMARKELRDMARKLDLIIEVQENETNEA